MTTKYISKTATNGYVVGVDTNDGLSKATPWLSYDKALTGVSSGDVIIFNDGTYTHSGIAQLATNVTLKAENPGLTTLIGTNSTRSLYLTATAAPISVTLDGVIISGNGASQNCISCAVTANKYTVNMINGAGLKDATTTLFLSPAALDFYARDISLTGPSTGNGLSLALPITSGAIDIDGVTVALTNKTTSLRGAIVIVAGAEGVTASVKNVAGSVSVNSNTGGHYGIRIVNVPDAVIDSCDLDITGGTVDAYGYNYSISSTGFTAANGIISNCTGLLGTPAGIIALIGEDSSATTAGKNLCNGGKIFNCDMTATGANIPHGYMLGNNTGGEIYNNKSTGAAFAAIFKGQTGGTAHHNVGIGVTSAGAFRTKASVDCTFYNNTATLASGSGLYANSDATTEIASTGIVFKNNICYFTGTATELAFCDVDNTATFSNNLYYSEVPLPANPFHYSGTNYATLELWQAAQEATAIYADPLFASLVNNNLLITSESPCIGAGADTGLTTDFTGVVFDPYVWYDTDTEGTTLDSTLSITVADVCSIPKPVIIGDDFAHELSCTPTATGQENTVWSTRVDASNYQTLTTTATSIIYTKVVEDVSKAVTATYTHADTVKFRVQFYSDIIAGIGIRVAAFADAIGEVSFETDATATAAAPFATTIAMGHFNGGDQFLSEFPVKGQIYYHNLAATTWV